MKGVKWLLGPALAAAAVVILSAQVFACTSLATLNLGTPSGAPGSQLTLTGSSFNTIDSGASAVALHWNGASGPVLTTVTPDASGAIAASITVPANAEPGYYIITATQTQGASGADAWGTPAKVAFQVVGPNGATSSQQQAGQAVVSPTSSGLSVAAGALLAVGVAGLLLFALGAVYFVGSYRRVPSVSPVRKR